VAVAEPFDPPKQLTLVLAVIEAVMPPVLGTTATAVTVHPPVEVTVTVYDPAASPVAVAPVPPDGAHEYV
jgi:hypothetical protein